MGNWAITFAIWAGLFAFSLHKEVTEGESIMGCLMRGWYGINDGACEARDD